MAKEIILKVNLVVLLLGIIGIGVLSQNESLNSKTIYLNNVGATKCWKGTCGHKSKTYSYSKYTVSSTRTAYHHGGTYLEPGASESCSISASYTRTLNISGGVDGEVAKASVGYSGSRTVGLSRTQTLTNKSKKLRKYPHLGVEYETRKNTVTIKERTYDPSWHITATNRYCEFKTTRETESCIMNTSCGLSLLEDKRNDF